jgi:hypothetical protein
MSARELEALTDRVNLIQLDQPISATIRGHRELATGS